MKKLASGIMLTLLLTSMLMLGFNTQTAKADPGTIYIRADGSIDPPTAPILTVDNVTYTLTGNITSDADGIVIERDNIVVDGAGYTIQGTEALDSKGIDLSGRTNVTVRDTQTENFYDGIHLTSSSNNSMNGNNITNNSYGIVCIFMSSDNNIGGNSITNNSYGILLFRSSKNEISGNNIANNDCGISFSYSSDNANYHNNFANNTQQVYFDNSVNVWDNGYPSGGNYWSDYNGTDLYSGPYQNETSSDGMGDTPYVIDADNQDRYPLMRPWNSFVLYGDVNGDGTVNILDVILVSKAFGTSEGDSNYDSPSDLNQDGRINILDTILVARHFGQHIP